nr:PREDICTED: uncharacterized protein LOC106703326 isoform X2 [Latimeria chalumnae]|eukprot:XP_014343437.1 PREDICTED: uncharacterized protein LOC106703326 isoform X2 [Latimeria chalumnae]
MPVTKQDTRRALLLLEDYCSKLKRPEEQQLKKAIKKVMGIFKSSLFQALLGYPDHAKMAGILSRKKARVVSGILHRHDLSETLSHHPSCICGAAENAVVLQSCSFSISYIFFRIFFLPTNFYLCSLLRNFA